MKQRPQQAATNALRLDIFEDVLGPVRVHDTQPLTVQDSGLFSKIEIRAPGNFQWLER